MGITYKIDIKAGVIFSVAEGEIGAAEIRENRDHLVADPMFNPNLNRLFDARLAQFSFSGKEARELTNWSQNNRPNSKLAVLIDKKNQNQGYVRMALGWAADDYSFGLFQDMTSAREWLGLPPEEG